MIKHDFVHSNEPQPETWLEAILAGLCCLACILLSCGYIYILSGIGGA
jgi:hypothetical protein